MKRNHTYQDHYLTASFFAPEKGGWFIDRLVWKDMEVVGGGAQEMPAGWECNLGGERFTPFINSVSAGECRVDERTAETVICCANTLGRLGRLDMEIKIDHNMPLIWQRVCITNESDHELELERLNFAQLKLSPEFLHVAGMRTYYASREADSLSAPLGLDDPAIVLHEPQLQKGLLAGSLAPGVLRRISPGQYFSMGYTHGETRFEAVLKPGESFTSDWAFFLFYDGDFQAASYRLIREHIRTQTLKTPLTYCSWIPFLRDIDADKVRKQMDCAADLGFELFLIDDGWQDRAGDWNAHPEKFPGGLAPVAEHARKQGMNLGLWIGLNSAHEDSWVARNRPEWLLTNENGRPIYTEVAEGRLALCCLDSPFYDWILERIGRLVQDLDLHYLKIDFPLVQDVYFNPPILCHHTGHNHANPRCYTWNAYQRLKQLCSELRQRYPELILDLTYELWGAFHAVDYAWLQWADVTWTSNLSDPVDQPSSAAHEARRLLGARSRLIPPGHILTGNLRCDSFNYRESVNAALEGFPCLLGDLEYLTAEQRAFIKRRFEDYKYKRGLL